MIDIFGHEYGWTAQYTLNLPITGAFLLLKRIRERYPKAKGESPETIMSVGSLTDLMRGK